MNARKQRGDAPDAARTKSSDEINEACLLWRLPKHTVAGLASFLVSRERDVALEATLEVFGYGSP